MLSIIFNFSCFSFAPSFINSYLIMKTKEKLVLIFLLIPYVSYAQYTKAMTTQDVIINALLENTINYLEYRNDVCSNKDLNINTKCDSIDWNNKQLIKWQIIEPKESLKIIFDEQRTNITYTNASGLP